MTFQTEVNIELAAGVPGEIIEDGPQRVRSLRVYNGSLRANRIGHAYTHDIYGNTAFVGGMMTGNRPFAGILVNPKAYANFGGADGPLAPAFTLPENTMGEFLTMGTIWVSLAAASSIGDPVIYEESTGQLSRMNSGGTPPTGWALVPNATVYIGNSRAGLAAIRLTN